MLIHLEAYEIGLVAGVTLLAIGGVQGLISAYLEDPGAKEAGERSASGSWSGFTLIVALFLMELFWAFLFIRGIFHGASASTLAMYGALLFFTLAASLIAYRRTFVPSETLIQERDDGVPW